MIIATWNVERLKHRKTLDKMLQVIKRIGAEILVLTETDTRLCPDYPNYYHTPRLHEIRPDYYRNTENRVSVYSAYKCVKQYETYDPYTAICLELETEHGNLLVYGTIMGIFGNREMSFKTDLKKQMEDIRRLSSKNPHLCVIGDYNLSFNDHYCFTREGRELVTHTFQDCGLDLLTGNMPECIDHIAVTKRTIDHVCGRYQWNMDKTLSDHMGIAINADLTI